MAVVMKHLFVIPMTLFLTVWGHICPGQGSPDGFLKPDTLHIPYTHSEITIDGSLDEWSTYATRMFSDSNLSLRIPEGYQLSEVYPGIDTSDIREPLSRNHCITRLCWNKNELYVAFIVKDRHLLGQWIGARDNPYICLNDAIEVYIDSRNDSRSRMDLNDYQFIVDVHNQQAALRGTISTINNDSMAVPKECGQNLVFTSAVVVNGNLTGEDDSAGLYVVEVRIPFLSLGLEPSSGDILRISLGVQDADYIHADLTNRLEVSYNRAFDWAGYNDFGYPKVWKTAVLSGRPSWYARISEGYQRYWLAVVLFLLGGSGMLIFMLFLYTRKKSRIPSSKSIEKSRVGQRIVTPDPTNESVSEGGKMMEEAIQFIRDHCKTQIRSEDVATHLSISLRTLQRITREEMECTPTGLIALVRIRMAADFLLHKQGNVSQAAYEFGFTDPAYFSRIFKQHFGVSPSDYLSGNLS
jgi:AraC-like DNA-binding protein